MSANLASATSHSSLPDHQDVGPTGGTGQDPPSFWGTVLKPRGAGSPVAKSESSGSKKASNVLGWLAGFGGRGNGGIGADAARADTGQPQVSSSSSSISDEAPTGGRREGGEAALVFAAESSRQHPPNDASSLHGGVPRLNSGERGATGGLPEVAITPVTASVVGHHGASAHAPRHAPQPVRTASSSSAHGGEPLAPSPHAADAHPVGTPLAVPASPGLVCMECEMAIQGAVFMLHDQAYCCQRHRLVAYHKNEREAQKGGAAPLLSHGSPYATGLRANFSTWM